MKEIFWTLPKAGFIKVNFHGASRGNTGCGFVFRDQRGFCMGAGSVGIRATTNFLTEQMVILLAVEKGVE